MRSSAYDDNDGKGWRKTLIPFDSAAATNWTRLFPITWESNTLYLGTANIRSDVNGGVGPEGTDPVKLIFMNFDATTVELGQTNWTNRGSSGNMLRVASPRLGAPQSYIGFFFSQNASASRLANAQRLRFTNDFMNTLVIGPLSKPGADAFAVEGMAVDKLVIP